MVKQAADKAVIDLARDNYQVQSANIEHFLKENAQIIIQVQVSLSPACSTRLPVTKSLLGDSKEILYEGNPYAMEVKIPDAMEHLEYPDWKKLSRTYPSMFVPTDTYITKSLDVIPKYHSMVGRITVQDKLELLWRGDIIRNKMK